MTDEYIIQTKGLTKRFGNFTAVDVTLDPDGGFAYRFIDADS